MKRWLPIAIILLVASPPALAAIPQTMSYQGVLTDGAGSPVPDGVYDLTFAIYDVSAAGAALWSETHGAVSVSGGGFDVVLGDAGSPLTLAFDQPYWLGITVSPDPELTPRVPLAASPYSLNARSLQLPYSGSAAVASPGAAFAVSNTASGRALSGTTAGTTPFSFAVYGLVSSAAPGGTSCGVRGENSGTGATGIGVSGIQNGTGWGVHGFTPGGRGVFGLSTSGVGVYGQSNGVVGMYAETSSGAMDARGLHAVLNNTTSGPFSAAVRGENRGSGTSAGTGVWGTHDGLGNGVFGFCAAGKGVYGSATSGDGVSGQTTTGHAVQGVSIGTGLAGYFSGDVTVTGTLTKGAGAFKIDHPLDPRNKYLSHSFVESPDMMNVYNGNVTLDGRGEAWVAMPAWFETLNRDYRYQLTPIGAPGPDLYVAQELRDGRWKIAGGRAGLKVSWQLTGIRQDPTADLHRIVVEEDKAPGDRGRYLDPRAYGQPPEKGIGVRRPAPAPLAQREGQP